MSVRKTSDVLAVYHSHVDILNSERETIWARNNALLVANTLLIGLIFGQSITSPELKLIVSAVGFAVCAAWLMMTYRGWELLQKHVNNIGSIDTLGLVGVPNPYPPPFNARETIYWTTMFVIAAFAILYAILFFVALCAVQ